MFGLGLTLFVVVMVLSVYFAGRLARARGRSSALWMAMTVFLGPPVVALLFLFPKSPRPSV